jgi:maltose O-acetyltransferase
MRRIKRLIVDIVRFIQFGDLPTSYYTKRGMVVGKNFNRQSGCKFDPSHCWLISIGDDVTFSNQVSILAHDDSSRIYTGYGRVGTVTIGNNVFVGAGVTILMNTEIGNDVIIGAGSVVTKSIPDDCVVAGIPAQVIGITSQYIEKCKDEMKRHPNFDLSWTIYAKEKLSEDKKVEMRTLLRNTHGYQQLWPHKD